MLSRCESLEPHVGHEAARVHRAAQRRGGGVAVYGARAAGTVAPHGRRARPGWLPFAKRE